MSYPSSPGVTATVASATIFLLTLALILMRPRGLNEAIGAGGGAIACLALRLVSFGDILQIARDTANVLIFLLGMMTLTGIAEHAGVFDTLAARAAWLARGSGHLLLVSVFLLGAIVTALLSLDVTVIIMTPIVYAVVTRIGIDPLPYLIACAFVANTASLFLPMSNLTNILMYDLLHLSFARFALVMFLPNIAALFVNIGIFMLLFRNRIPRTFTLPEHDTARHRPGFLAAAATVASVLAAIFVFGVIGWPLAIPAIVGAVVLGVAAVARKAVSPRQIGAAITWPLFPFVFAMFVVMRAVERAWFGRLGHLPSHADFGTLATIAFGTGVGANIVNNIPMAVAMISLLRSVAEPARDSLAFATLIGVNIGPSILPIGSLATMLWLAAVRQRGVIVKARTYTMIGLLTTPTMVAAATVVLWLEIRFLHI
ncbi:MAG: ArsB/NhaD family transporter [Thermomicrobiales bacterium]